MKELKKGKIIAAFKTHFDYGYTDLAREVLRDFCTKKLADALEICEYTKDNENKKYIWTLPAYLLMQMVEHCPNDKKERLKALIEKDQIVCHALPFTMHTELLDEKLLNKMFLWTDEYASTYQKSFPVAAKMTDVPGHTSAIIKPLISRGVKFLHLGKNGASLAPNVPLLFWWEDLQGNRILTMYNQNYGSNLFPPKGWKYPVWLALCQTYDNAGVQDKGYIEEISMQVENSGFDFTTGSLDDFAREILKCDLSDLPVVKGELANTWVHGNGTYPKAMGEFRRIKAMFYELEKVALENGSDISKEQNEFYKNALVFCEHTFGINILRYFGQNRAFEKDGFAAERKSRKEYAFAEESWAEQESRVEIMRNIADVVQKKLDYQRKDKVEENLTLSVNIKKSKVFIEDGEKRYALWYEYKIFGANQMANFQRRYLTRFFDWSISDFGRNYYPEIPSKTFRWLPQAVERRGNRIYIPFKTPKASAEEYGNVVSGTLILWQEEGKIRLSLDCDLKNATAMLEAGNFIVETYEKGEQFIVEQGGNAVNIDTDIVENANQILWSVDRFARIDNTVLYTYDAPLVSFGENAIYEFNGGKPRNKKPRFVVNLFNNQWGTNFPQWIEGKFVFDFAIECI